MRLDLRRISRILDGSASRLQCAREILRRQVASVILILSELSPRSNFWWWAGWTKRYYAYFLWLLWQESSKYLLPGHFRHKAFQIRYVFPPIQIVVDSNNAFIQGRLSQSRIRSRGPQIWQHWAEIQTYLTVLLQRRRLLSCRASWSNFYCLREYYHRDKKNYIAVRIWRSVWTRVPKHSARNSNSKWVGRSGTWKLSYSFNRKEAKDHGRGKIL